MNNIFDIFNVVMHSLLANGDEVRRLYIARYAIFTMLYYVELFIFRLPKPLTGRFQETFDRPQSRALSRCNSETVQL